jgi:hypothetical protein
MNLKNFRNRALIMSMLTMSVTYSFAEGLYYDLSSTAGTADYLLGSRLVENASYSSSALSISNILSDNSRAYLDISFNKIIPFEEYSSSTGELGLQLRYLEIKDNQMFAGIYGFLNTYHDTYSYYNSSGFGMYGKWKHYFKATQLITMGYDLNFKKFEEVAEASNSEHEIYAIYNQTFRSKTSIKLESGLALQDFWEQTSVAGRGRFITSTEISDIPSNMLVTNELRISQSLGSKLGLTMWLGAQSLLNDIADSSSLQDGLDNPFTDRFRWEGPSASTRVLYRLNEKNSFKFVHSYSEKSYLDVPVYEFDFQTMDYSLINDEFVKLGYDREDKRNSIQLNWTRSWVPRYDSWLTNLDLGLGLGLVWNESNDALYDYESMSYNISLSFNN